MNYVPVLPVGMYDLADHGNMHLVQAHLLEDKEWATELFFKWGQSKHHTVILDNGVAENGEPAIDALFKVAGQIMPDEIVCPDVIRDADATIRNMIDYGRDCKNLASVVMLVPQGTCIEEWVDCCLRMLSVAQEYSLSFSIGVSKFLETNRGGRFAALAWLTDLFEHRGPRSIGEIHCLGCFQDFDEMVRYSRDFPTIRSFDSTWAYANAWHNVVLCRGSAHLYSEENRAWKFPMTDEMWEPREIRSELVTRTVVNIAVCRAELRIRRPFYD